MSPGPAAERLDRRPGDRPAADVAEFVERVLRDGLPDGALRLLTLPAPDADPEAFVLRDPRTAVFWSMPGGPVQAGAGAAVVIEGSGPGRFEAVRREAERLWKRVSVSQHPAAAPVPPRLFGGLAFLPGPLEGPWRSFGEARFVLPRLLLTRDASGSRLTVAVTAAELERRGAAGLAEDVAGVLDGLAAHQPASPASEANPRAAGAVGPADRESWRRAVASVQRRIQAGVGEKIVAARSRSVPMDRPADLPEVLRRLDRESATAARFLFRFGESVFLGATPERLVGRTGPEVRTEALAGTVPAGSPEREARLLASLKDGVEHGYVVQAIAEALGPLCERLRYPAAPRIQRLRHVVHLQTPFIGQLREPVHVLRLVERLHPTPAVGGWPTGPALEWIEREELEPRGWYAAPVGWFDDRGDGEFGVALRSALLHGGEARLYAGAGIVRDSDADAEFDETEVKLRTMMEALGIRP